jgi:hypothetical protein
MPADKATILRVARLLRLGDFPTSPGPLDWQSVGGVPGQYQAAVLAWAEFFANLTPNLPAMSPDLPIETIFADAPVSGQLPFGSPIVESDITLFLAVNVEDEIGRKAARSYRVKVPIGTGIEEAIQMILKQIEEILGKCGFTIVEIDWEEIMAW